MPLIAQKTQSNIHSPFFQRFEKIALDWEKFGNDLGVEVSGKYNEYMIDAHCEIAHPQGKLMVHGNIHMVSVTTNTIPLDSRYSEKTTFKIKVNTSGKKGFKIKKKSLFRKLFKGYKSYPQNPAYIFKAENTALFLRVTIDHPFHKEILTPKLSKFEFDSTTGILYFHTHHFIKGTEELKKVFEYIQYVIDSLDD